MAKRRVRYKPGDIFLIPCPSQQFAFGRILLDLHRLRHKTNVYDRVEHCSLAGPVAASGLLVAIFHHIENRYDESYQFSMRDLRKGPPFYVSHSQIYDATFRIIDNFPVRPQELDFPEGTLRHYSDKIGYTFKKGGISVEIQMTNKEYASIGGAPGIRFGINPEYLIEDLRDDKFLTEYDMHDLRNSEQHEEILLRAGLEPNMSYSQMADITGGISPEELLTATEMIYPNTTSMTA